MGIGYVALGGFGAKCRTGWSGWSGVDTPWTVMTTRAPAVLTKAEFVQTLICSHKSNLKSWGWTAPFKLSYKSFLWLLAQSRFYRRSGNSCGDLQRGEVLTRPEHRAPRPQAGEPSLLQQRWAGPPPPPPPPWWMWSTCYSRKEGDTQADWFWFCQGGK